MLLRFASPEVPVSPLKVFVTAPRAAPRAAFIFFDIADGLSPLVLAFSVLLEVSGIGVLNR